MREHEIGRVENGKLIVPTEREYKGVLVSNPTKEQLKYLRGYSDIDKEQFASVEIPEHNDATQFVDEVYFINEETNKINKRYEIRNISDIVEGDEDNE